MIRPVRATVRWAGRRALARAGIRRTGDHWVWVGGPVPPGADAITMWSLVSVRRAVAGDARLLAHEAAHVRQWRSLGVRGFLRAYLGAYLAARRLGYGHVAAYRLIPLEIDAERAAARVVRPRPEAGGGLP